MRIEKDLNVNEYTKAVPAVSSLPLPVRILTVILIFGASSSLVIPLIYHWNKTGVLISTDNASSDIAGILIQHLIIASFPILLLIVFWILLKKDFSREMYLRVKGLKQWIFTGIPAAVLLVMLIYCLFTKEDKISTVYEFIYYTFFVAFTEEFMARGVSPYILKNDRAWIRYLIPGLLWALMHIFNYSGWGQLSAEYVIHFLRNDMIVLLGVGCLLQLIKEKSGTIWIPVLIHACYDLAFEVAGK